MEEFKTRWKGISVDRPRMLMEIFEQHNDQMKALVNHEFSPLYVAIDRILDVLINTFLETRFLEKLSSGNHGNISLHQHLPSIERPENKSVVVSAKDLTNADLINYLDSRGIDLELANKFCKEIEFKISKALSNFVTDGSKVLLHRKTFH